MACCEVSEPEQRRDSKSDSVAKRKHPSKESGGEGSGRGGKEQDPQRLAELYFLAGVAAGDWPKAGEVRTVLERRGSDREVCRAAAKASENIVAHEKGLDTLVERGILQQLAEVWQQHANDTVLAVHVNHIVARFWEKACNDPQWYLLPASQAAGKALAGTGRQEWLSELLRVAVKLHDSRSLSASEETYKLAILRFEDTLGAVHATTLQARNNLAVLLEEQGKFEESESMHREVLGRCEKSLGADHANTLSVKFNLAVLWARQDKQQKKKEAEDLYRQVIEARKRVLGNSHADTLRAESNLAGLLRKTNKLRESEDLYRIVANQRQEALGRDHTDTLRARLQLALVLAQQGDRDKPREAVSHLREVVTQREKALGKHHTETITALFHLSVMLEERQPQEAEQLSEQVWQRLDFAVPELRRRTRPPQSNFAANLEQGGQPEQAESLLRGVADRRQGTLGADHPDTLAARSELASLLARRGQAAEAVALRRDVAKRCDTAMGPLHMDTLTARASLAQLLRRGAGLGDADRVGRVAARQEADVLTTETVSRFAGAVSKEVGGTADLTAARCHAVLVNS
eukprot:gnl/TRDRNA2_/TRDRNA2_202984_c0_seq1.p1 gnl/TRDRNA2_/TRDRNA2_202984_c0~~gnl/TRDRNA2_/TRDRNA2_202984_c0_seq1.p1  ORF type:complete len:576 (+),score=130.11 gnl/TRDRNA2_/TRDRNA2_202984_c0_seq1:118-1845(+)